MGIPSLLNLLKSIEVKRHIKEYKDQTVAVDVYTWQLHIHNQIKKLEQNLLNISSSNSKNRLHPAIFTCSYELANNIETTKHIDYCVKKVDSILSHGIKKIVLVFDGRQLPSKKGTEEKREKSREDNKNEALRLMLEGKREEANKKFASSIDVTPQMAYEFIQAVQGRHNVECIVSPYEADSQLAYLSKIGYVDVVFSEDSDLLAFGCKKVLFKLYKGEQKDYGDEICLENIKNCRDINLSLWNHNMFLTACIFAGCDYLPSLKKMGINTAFKLVGEHKIYQKCFHTIQQKNYEVPSYYDEKFQLAFLTFRFQYVYCPLKERIVHLNSFDQNALKIQYIEKDFHNTNYQINWRDFEENVITTPLIFKILDNNFDWSFLGDMDEKTAIKVAKYQIDPSTLQPYKEVMQNRTNQYRNSNQPIKIGSQQFNKNIFDKISRTTQSVSNSILSGKQNSISNYVKLGLSKQSLQKSQSFDSSKSFDKNDFLLEDVNSNLQSQSQFNERKLEMTQSKQFSQVDQNFTKSLFSKNSSLLKPFKPPSTQNSQISLQLSKKKSALKRACNEDYFISSDEEMMNKDYFLKEDRIIERQIEEAISKKKDIQNKESNNNLNFDLKVDLQKLQKQKEFAQKNENLENQYLIKQYSNIDNKNNMNINVQNINQQNNMLQNLSNFKSNLSNEKKLIGNQSKDQQILSKNNETTKKSKENSKLNKKQNKKLIIDKTPINQINLKTTQTLFKYNFSLQKMSKTQNNTNKEDLDSDKQHSIKEDKYSIQGEKYHFQRAKEQNEYALEQQVQFTQCDSQYLQNYIWEDNKSNISTQSQDKHEINQDNITKNKYSLEKIGFNTLSLDTSSPKKVVNEYQSQDGSSKVMNTTVLNKAESDRTDKNIQKPSDGNIVLNSQYLLQQHPEYNFLDKFSIFFKNEHLNN